MNTKRAIRNTLLFFVILAVMTLCFSMMEKSDKKNVSQQGEPVVVKGYVQQGATTRVMPVEATVPVKKSVGQLSVMDDRHRTPPERIRLPAGKPQKQKNWVEPAVTVENAADIFSLLNDGTPPGVRKGRWHAAQNRMMASLCSLESPAIGVTEELVVVYENRELDVVTRNYALQYLSYYQHKKETEPGQELIENVLWEGVRNDEKEITPTALLALSRLNLNDREKEELIEHAVEILRQRRSSRLQKIAAVSSCAELGAQVAIPELRNAVEQVYDLPLKAAAINALKKLNDPWAIEVEVPCIALQQ